MCTEGRERGHYDEFEKSVKTSLRRIRSDSTDTELPKNRTRTRCASMTPTCRKHYRGKTAQDVGKVQDFGNTSWIPFRKTHAS
jgi:hypothetical protein